ncbi:flagellar biosynthesis protein FlgA [Micrococcus sp. NPDC078436]|uniref:flagellar biosynthesis protein FlgA n=1 Tax=unclassified Micrococcus TaxID=2620948 RepID=UPI0029BDB642|nr:flagellar biosynthesis protein FlgA [Micrococcus sp. M4NT]MDX2341911.1 flagellar biosynthesis protein FlgA [Micrococcus sp. M4NT]
MHVNAPAEGTRLRRPRWRDPRLIVGLVLVLVSVAGVVALVSASQRTQSYWAATRDIVPGAPVEAEQFAPAEANLGDAGHLYLRADGPPPAGRVASGTVRAGELVPLRLLGEVDPQRRRPVGVELDEPLPDGVGVGDRVDVWVAAPVEGGRGHADPQRLAEGIEIIELAEDQGALGGGPTARVQLMVDEDVLPRLLDAKVTDARITVVPALGAA